MKITYEPIKEEFEESLTRAELDDLIEKLQSFYLDKEPERVIQLEESKER